MRRVMGLAVLCGLAVASLALPGCRLIDQRSFEPPGVAPTQAQQARARALAAAQAARPLVRVLPGDLDHDWRPDVLAAVRGALARDPDAAFDVVTPYPSDAPESARADALATGSADAASVASVIEADGVPAERLHLSTRGDRGQPARAVMVFLR